MSDANEFWGTLAPQPRARLSPTIVSRTSCCAHPGANRTSGETVSGVRAHPFIRSAATTATRKLFIAIAKLRAGQGPPLVASRPDMAKGEPMSKTADWSGARGEKWLKYVSETEAMLEPIDAPLLRALQLSEPLRIADLGCGGGGTTIALLRHAPEGSTVAGYDISPVLIDYARGRAHSRSGV